MTWSHQIAEKKKREIKTAKMMAKERIRLDRKTNEEIYVVGCEHELSFSLSMWIGHLCALRVVGQCQLTMSY